MECRGQADTVGPEATQGLPKRAEAAAVFAGQAERPVQTEAAEAAGTAATAVPAAAAEAAEAAFSVTAEAAEMPMAEAAFFQMEALTEPAETAV